VQGERSAQQRHSTGRASTTHIAVAAEHASLLVLGAEPGCERLLAELLCTAPLEVQRPGLVAEVVADEVALA
jgi:hypothetical protein